ncbi:TPA: O23 family O-antigen flippase [Salmonella enterica subsp. houtenae]|nr:O23 family O-antigen flippase [Salmonella enterica subsp. houtenae]ECT3982167.1 O23 family O-antigen flippase [Salmonella enterica subsp. houtenae serovar 53:z4,z23:-]EKO1018325.1 O23 family O-antigen flippase [Salmonella enterica subsp. enterica]ECF6025005.1 O23 family O-antigen flippase [Salmonella enterica subsp. houtenae]ECJ2496475.1 O23 family O-antigen flippase [Salmonella enterica subsp. houtenae]
MFIKIISKIKKIILPSMTLGASTIFFFSIGFLYGIDKNSDFILLTITILSTIGTILQFSWYGLLPRLTSSKSEKFTSYIISNGSLYCFIINLIPFFLIAVDGFHNVFLSGCLYSLIYQLHQFYKNVFVYIGRLKAFYIFDAGGYSFSILLMAVFYYKVVQLSPSEFFLLLAFSWFFILLAEVIFLRNYFIFRFSVKPIYTCIIPTWKTRVANSGFIIKDMLTSYMLNALVPGGGLTIYSYANKMATAIFQLFSQYKVNFWVGEVKKIGLKKVRSTDIKKISFLSSVDYCLFLCLLFSIIYLVIFFAKIKIDLNWALLSFISSGTLYLIQSIEQPFARFIYMSRDFSSIAFTDGMNFITYILFFIYGYLDGNIYIIMLGIVAAQLFSLYLYLIYCNRLLLR